MTHRYRVLGATRALRPDGTEVRLSGARLRALLTALAGAGGRAVGTGELVAQVWGEDEERPADAVGALQALVGRLRRALGGEAVASAPGGYRLVAGRDSVDLFRFERLAADGAAALREDDPERALTLLDEGLALWDGPALADLPGRVSDPLAVRAEQRRAAARRDRLAAEVARGRPERALAGLAALAAGAPLDEPLHALRIRALRAAGRPAEALQAYDGVRTVLATRLGTDPGPELRALHAELLAGDAPPSPAPRTTPNPNSNPHPHPTPRTTTPVGNLRAGLTSFLGREAELAALGAELTTARLVTLIGAGGAGKTRLSLEVARAAATRAHPPSPDGRAWPDGVWVVELAPVREASAVAEAVLTVLGARQTAVQGSPGVRGTAAVAPPSDPLDQLAEHCGQRRMLLLLDNCEHVIGAAAGLAEALLTRCPGVTVLATSREPLGVPGESVRPVEPLPQDVALRLLAERGAAGRPGFRVTDDPDACAEICRRLDGLPLALELAAARLRALDPRQIADRLDDRFRLLGTGSGSRTVLPRQQTLRAVVDWSWDLLAEDERAVLRRLSVFSGGCSLAEAEAVCATPDTLSLLASLVDKSLVVAATGSRTGPAPAGMRYRLLETVGEYAAERLAESGEREAVERRHLAAYRELVRVGDPELRGRGQTHWLGVFEREHDNVRAALRTAVDHKEEQEALCLVLAMSWFWQLRNHRADALAWSSAVAALGPDPFEEPVRPAVPLTEPCTALPPPWSEDQVWEARRGIRLILLAGSDDGALTADGPGPRSRLRAIVSAYGPGLPQNCRQPGTTWFFARLMTGDLPGITETMEELVLASRAQGDSWHLGLALMLRAKLLNDRTEGLIRSGLDADEALALFERAGDLYAIAESLSARAETHERQGRHEAAATDLARAMECCARIGAHGQIPLFKARLASVRLDAAGAAGDQDAARRAEELLVEAVEENAVHFGQTAGTSRLLLARRYGRTGRTDLARAQLRTLEEENPYARRALFGGMVAGLHGWLDCLEGEYDRALDHLRLALARFDRLVFLVAPHLIVSQLPSAAWATARLGEPEAGARLLGAHARHTELPEGIGLHPFPPASDTEIQGHAEAVVRAALDGPAYARAHAEGRDLTVKEAAALI
ncbi:BTAD domain-containing putative transcriptional regulator [Streptomyces sp. NPDC088261]|uniref:BTAD domain-containing putative transcriptional regulator n=1 Tax=Streptomyces sp. NPDC088261 TaxID=3365851 RepID=UPI0037FF285F